uniref:Methyltransferase small domain-containing protein n=1 Tax=Glossina morsitans morsitans TaxID=37546 RepID=A0A1B0G9W3_GLOMM
MLEVDCGSGAISLAILNALRQVTTTAIESSKVATTLAWGNAKSLKLSDQLADRKFDLIVSNPPYVRTEELPLLQPEVKLGKRRNREDDLQCESAPLCKRINGLHSSNFEATNQQQLQGINNSYHSQQQYLPKDIIVTQPLTPQHMESLTHHPIATYNPDLNEVENPYYYAKNKLLHELHLERLKRFSS